MSDKITETAPVTSQGRSTLPCESAFALATRVSGPTPVVTHSGDVSRLEPTTSMVLRSQTTGGAGCSAGIPDVEFRPEIEFRQEPEMEKPAEIEVSVSTICEWDLGATGPITAENPSELAEAVNKYVLGDRPETVTSSSLLASQEINPKPTSNTSTSPNLHFHNRICLLWSLVVKNGTKRNTKVFCILYSDVSVE